MSRQGGTYCNTRGLTIRNSFRQFFGGDEKAPLVRKLKKCQALRAGAAAAASGTTSDAPGSTLPGGADAPDSSLAGAADGTPTVGTDGEGGASRRMVGMRTTPETQKMLENRRRV